MDKLKWKGAALLAPLPAVLVTSRYKGEDNMFTVAWAGIINSDTPKCSISIRSSRLSYDMIKNSGVFVINLPTSYMAKAVDYCGCVSGRTTDKFATTGLKTQQADKVDCLILDDCPISLECKVSDIISLGSHDMFLADILAVNVSPKYVDEKGKLHIERCSLLAYAHGTYFALGKKVGQFGFSVRKKHKSTARRKNPKLK